MGTSRHWKAPCHASAIVTTGLRCAPEIGPKVRISATSAAPVATVLASNAIETLPPASRSPIIPEPTTAASRKAVPTSSETARRSRLGDVVGIGAALDDVDCAVVNSISRARLADFVEALLEAHAREFFYP